MIRNIANLAIYKWRIKDLDTLRTVGGRLTFADPLDEYIAATDNGEGN